MNEKQKKFNFCKDLSDAITRSLTNVDSIVYELFYDKEKHPQEYVVVNYKGGAKSILDVNVTSCARILRDISNVMEHGDYSHVFEYNDWLNKVKNGEATKEVFTYKES